MLYFFNHSPLKFRMRTTFTLTHVQFESEDGLFGQLLALSTLAPFFIFAYQFFILIEHKSQISFKRERFFCLIGLLGNEVINQILKRTLKHQRPPESERRDYGMPSSHSQFISFWAIYWLLHNIPTLSRVMIISVAIVVAYSRHHLCYHSLDQIIVGMVVGGMAAYIWKTQSRKIKLGFALFRGCSF